MNAAIIVAGGSGERLGQAGGKQLLEVCGRPVLSHAIAAFEECAAIDTIVVVTHPARVDEYRQAAIDPLASTKVAAVVGGGSTRQESVAAGFAALGPDIDIVAIHDGARPLVTPDLVGRAIAALQAEPALAGVVVGHPSYDTMKHVDEYGVIVGTPDRATLWAAQTPQVFRAPALLSAHAAAAREGYIGTDDASLVERAGGVVRMLEGPRNNIKVTVAEDLALVELLLSGEIREASMGTIRVGIGYDAHAFSSGRPLVLGGVSIPFAQGLAGHSDADVLAHALMDAIVSALREGDIGRLYPDTDPVYRDISSLELLRRVAGRMREGGFRLVDADTVLVLERPKISPYREEMRARLADALAVDVSCVGVKATTTEGLGYEGRGEGVAAQAIVILERVPR